MKIFLKMAAQQKLKWIAMTVIMYKNEPVQKKRVYNDEVKRGFSSTFILYLNKRRTFIYNSITILIIYPNE